METLSCRIRSCRSWSQLPFTTIQPSPSFNLHAAIRAGLTRFWVFGPKGGANPDSVSRPTSLSLFPAMIFSLKLLPRFLSGWDKKLLFPSDPCSFWNPQSDFCLRECEHSNLLMGQEWAGLPAHSSAGSSSPCSGLHQRSLAAGPASCTAGNKHKRLFWEQVSTSSTSCNLEYLQSLFPTFPWAGIL